MSKLWAQRRRKDLHYKMAKTLGYRSRAAFKLLQANKSFRFLKPKSRVLDLGCAPGGWLQAASELTGPTGFVWGVDVRAIEPLNADNVQFIQADLTVEEDVKRILSIVKDKVDIVLSDVSPNISGVWDVDIHRQLMLAQTSLTIAQQTLREGGSFFVKIFDGPHIHDFRRQLKQWFQDVHILKPAASKPSSSELYFLALKRKHSSSPNPSE